METIEKALELKKELDSLRPIKKEDEIRIMQKFRLDWNYHSNHLEGNSLTYGETKALILFGITAQGKPLKDHFEVTGHDEAINWVLDIIKQDRPLTENFIRELHKLLLKESYEVDAITPDGQPTKKRVNVGMYKTAPNHVKTKTGEIFRFSTPEETPLLMNELLIWYREKTESDNFNPILLATEFHYRFIRIHPFDDGNGRTARILMNFILMEFGYPPVIIKTEDKENYFAALQQADAGLLEPFIEYIASNMNSSLEIMINGAKGEDVEEPDDLLKELTLLEQRLNNVGSPIEKTKNAKVMQELFSSSFLPLVDKFFEKSKLFNKFYKNTSFAIGIDGTFFNYYNITESFLSKFKSTISDNTGSLQMKYSFNIFNQHGFENDSFILQITFGFDYAKYNVHSGGRNVTINNIYGEDLTKDDMSKLIKSEMKRHKTEIERKIEFLKENKN